MSDIASRHMENPDMPGNVPGAGVYTPPATQSKPAALLKKITSLTQGGKQYFDEANEVRLSEIQNQLEVGNDREKLVAMKRLLAVCNTCTKAREEKRKKEKEHKSKTHKTNR